jgi:hypothetical protein
MGGTGTANYTVSVNKNGFADKDWAVSGEITVTNPLNNESISIKEIKDVVSPSNTAASVTGCTSGGNDIPLPSASQPYTLAPNASLECSYSATLGGATNGKNTATAVSNTTGIGDGVGTADVTFGAPTTEKDKSVTVSDSYSGGPQNKSVSLSDVSTAAKTFPYSRTIGPYETCGQKDAVENTATLYGDNNAVLGSDSASVAVRVLCKAVVDKTLSGAAVSGSESFVFQLREGASLTKEGTVLEQVNANAQNGGDFTFTKGLVPGSTYQLCEQVMAGWMTTLGPPLYAIYSPSGDNSTVCTDFKAGETKTTTPGGTSTFTIDNQPPPGGLARTIGYWKNWSSCSGGKQKPVLDQTLAKSETGGIATGILTLHGNTATPDKATDCLKAVRLLSKQTIDGKKSMASDPAFNLASQYLAAKLNVVAGAGVNGTATTAINEAQTLLSAIKFNGSTHDKMTAAQITKANSLAKTLDDYNNNRLNNLLTT